MIVLDTHAWLWWISSPGKLSRAAIRALARADHVGVSTMSIFELVALVSRRRIQLGTPVRTWIRDALSQERVVPLVVTPEIAADAAQLHFAGDPIDRLIYATARSEDAVLITRDERIRAFDRERTLW